MLQPGSTVPCDNFRSEAQGTVRLRATHTISAGHETERATVKLRRGRVEADDGDRDDDRHTTGMFFLRNFSRRIRRPTCADFSFEVLSCHHDVGEQNLAGINVLLDDVLQHVVEFAVSLPMKLCWHNTAKHQTVKRLQGRFTSWSSASQFLLSWRPEVSWWFSGFFANEAGLYKHFLTTETFFAESDDVFIWFDAQRGVIHRQQEPFGADSDDTEGADHSRLSALR